MLDTNKLTKIRYRTCLLGEIEESFCNKGIKVAGWVRKKRDHGKVVFIDLADGSCFLQCVIDHTKELFNKVAALSNETVVSLDGKLVARSQKSVNSTMKTGAFELQITGLEILSVAEELPFSINKEDLSEELALRYRFLYLRREEMQNILKMRTKIIDLIRKYMKDLDFLEIQTPILTSSSPEGARDYLVPSRLYPGKFYALPQAPQQFKQLLIAAGVDRYFQIAPCFRDEDSRADRLVGEFYQLDFEMAFATQEDVFQVLEYVFYHLFTQVRPDCKTNAQFPRIAYNTAIEKYGSDKPDLRNPLVIEDISSDMLVHDAFKALIITAPVTATPIINNTEEMLQEIEKEISEFGSNIGINNIFWCRKENNIWFYSDNWAMLGSEQNIKDSKDKLIADKSTYGRAHNTIFLISQPKKLAYKLAGALRSILGKKLQLIDENEYKFCLITDFPMFEFNNDTNSWDFMHNPFSMPQNIDEPDIEKILSYQYDVVCNGYELSSGAVRNYQPDIVRKVFKVIGDNCLNLEERFPIFKAFKYGTPPHAGSAPGIDRIIMLLTNSNNVRNTVAFPLSQNGKSELMQCPSEIDDSILKGLELKKL